MFNPGPGDADHDREKDDGHGGDGEEHGLVRRTQRQVVGCGLDLQQKS
jgi:hypothetical protein